MLNYNTETLDWLEERTILLAPTGSYAYGTNTEESDRDYKGVCVPPKEYYLGLKTFNEYNNTGGKNFVNTKDDVDVSILHVSKFVKDLVECVPNSLEMLFLEETEYMKLTELGKLLRDNRHIFLSKKVFNKYGGYARSQASRMGQIAGKGREELYKEFGYDTKMFMHSVRLLQSATEIFQTGDYNTKRPNAEFLLWCRQGKYTLKEAEQMLEGLDFQMNDAYRQTDLPKTAKYNTVNALLIEINERGLSI